MGKTCAQPEVEAARAAQAITVVETPTAPPSSGALPSSPASREAERLEERVSRQIAFRRALIVSCGLWLGFMCVDLAAIHSLHAGRLAYFVAVRFAVFCAAGLAFVLLRSDAKGPSEARLLAVDILVYCSAAIGIALLCVEFRGLASPYVPGFCLVLLSRAVTAAVPWRRGVVLTSIPFGTFFTVLVGSAIFSPTIAAQLHDPAALTTLLINGAYVLGAACSLVIGGHIVWSLRRQVFEARSLGRYRLKRRLAAGGMGDVWLAYHPGLKRDVAVKILRPDDRERSGLALARFEREVRATAELVHPNTVRVYDYGVTEDGLWYYVMELLEGETLADYVTRLGPLPPARAVYIVGQAARALAEAHERGIVHRDVKPENMFLTSLGGEHDFVKVIDFGIARLERDETRMTDTGSLLGTPAYMSPEMAMGLTADARSDVYALGSVLYFLLSGRPPFEADNAGAMIFAHVNERVVPPSRILGRPIPADVEAVVLRSLAKDPAERFANGAELALALSACGLAGRWTFGDAAIARRSSRPPPVSGTETLPSLRPPKVPRFPELKSVDGGIDAVHDEASGGSR
jgi:serine/threonine-protein kinase